MKQIFFILALMAMLALMGCKDSNDEPDYSKPPRIYVAINELPNGYVFDIEGNVIYECPQYSHIIKLASEDKDWYAVRSRHDDNNYNTVLYEVLKKRSSTVPDTLQSRVHVCRERRCLYVPV